MIYPMWNDEKTGIIYQLENGGFGFVDSGPEFEALKNTAHSFERPELGPMEAERADMVCSRAQGKLAIGPEVWALVVAMADDPETPWGLKVAIYDTYEWRRLDPNMDVLIWAMQLTPEEADDLFRLAMTL